MSGFPPGGPAPGTQAPGTPGSERQQGNVSESGALSHPETALEGRVRHWVPRRGGPLQRASSCREGLFTSLGGLFWRGGSGKPFSRDRRICKPGLFIFALLLADRYWWAPVLPLPISLNKPCPHPSVLPRTKPAQPVSRPLLRNTSLLVAPGDLPWPAEWLPSKRLHRDSPGWQPGRNLCTPSLARSALHVRAAPQGSQTACWAGAGVTSISSSEQRWLSRSRGACSGPFCFFA